MTVVAIGNFDGVHRGHQAVLQRARCGASSSLVVMTFWPHPVGVLHPQRAPKLLTSLHTRIELLRRIGADEVRVVRFNDVVARLSPAEFVQEFLLPLKPERIVVGHNFRFGHRAVGDVEALRTLGEGHFEVEAVALAQAGGVTTSSTRIRQAVAEGDLETAALHLGRPFEVRGLVVVGDRRGRALGFPTANLIADAQMVVPADGVYAGWLRRIDVAGGPVLPTAISVGSNPTFDGLERRVEAHVLDRDDLSLYGVEVGIDFVQRLRGQTRFGSAEELVDQMHRDVLRARRALDVR